MAETAGNTTRFVLMILAAIGVPIGALFTGQLPSNPWEAIAIAAGWAGILALLGFGARVLEPLTKKWSTELGEWLDSFVRRAVLRYDKRYWQYLQYKHRAVDIKGLTTQGMYTLELQRVFVSLAVAPQSAHRISANPVRSAASSNKAQIWRFLASDQTEFRNLAILGPPGSGKTTLLKHVVLSLSANGGRYHGVKLKPFLVYVREYVKVINQDPSISLIEIIRSSLTKLECPPPPGWVERQLDGGSCLVLLDGLDEVADPALRIVIAGWIEQQMTAFRRSRYVVTSRPFGYRTNPLEGVTILEVQPFSMAQISEFVQNWYLANEVMSMNRDDPGTRMAAKEGAEDLIFRLAKSSPLMDLAVNPLLLTMLATVHRFRSSLPGSRSQLYSEICDVFFGRRQEAHRVPVDITPDQKRRVLQPLAYEMMVLRLRYIPRSQAMTSIAATLASVCPNYEAGAFLKNVESGVFT